MLDVRRFYAIEFVDFFVPSTSKRTASNIKAITWQKQQRTDVRVRGKVNEWKGKQKGEQACTKTISNQWKAKRTFYPVQRKKMETR